MASTQQTTATVTMVTGNSPHHNTILFSYEQPSLMNVDVKSFLQTSLNF